MGKQVKLKPPEPPKESIDTRIDNLINAPMDGVSLLKKLDEIYRLMDITFPELPPREGKDQKWDPEIAKKILILRAYGWSAKKIEAIPGMPSRITIGTWKKEKPDFGQSWDEMFEMYLDIEAEETIPIADGTNADKEDVMLSKLRILTRQISAGRRLPHKWGQQTTQNQQAVIINHTEIVKKDSQTQVEVRSDSQRLEDN
jgi:hypothetical protein